MPQTVNGLIVEISVHSISFRSECIKNMAVPKKCAKAADNELKF